MYPNMSIQMLRLSGNYQIIVMYNCSGPQVSAGHYKCIFYWPHACTVAPLAGYGFQVCPKGPKPTPRKSIILG